MLKPVGILVRDALFLFGAFVIVIAGVWLISLWPSDEPESELLPPETAVERGAETMAESFDADSDGLSDWEERLWGTDPNNTDSDGDGTGDGDEVAIRRDPTRAPPDDLLQTPLSVIAKDEEVLEKPLPTAVTKENTPAPTGQSVPATTTENESNASLRLFGNEAGALIQEASHDAESELAVWNSATGDMKMTAELAQGFNTIAQKYDRLAKDLALLSPPTVAKAVHDELTSAYQKYAEAVLAIANTPIGSYMSEGVLISYSDRTLALARAFVAVSDFFYTESVAFGRTEPGSIFSFPR